MRLDLAVLMHVAYALTGSDESWLAGLTEVLEPLLGAGFGVAAWSFQHGEWGPAPTPYPGVAPEMQQAMNAAATAITHDQAACFFLGPRTQSASERLGRPRGFAREPFFATLHALGVQDIRALTLLESSGAGVAFAAPAPTVVQTGRAYRARLERVGAHILAGQRLRRTLGKVDAVLAADGKMLDACDEARAPEHREALRAAVKAFDRAACQHGQNSADEALDAWRALVAGRWSLVQSFESDGRRYLVARRNPPGAAPNSSLSALEAHALLLRAQGAGFKLIGYELGVSVSAAHGLVQKGCAKLGIGADSELPAFVAHVMSDARVAP